jgi:hypothetical protein
MNIPNISANWPVAIVASYTQTSATVRCPYCGYLESHASANNKDGPQIESIVEFIRGFGVLRLALCEDRLSLPYVVGFPGDGHDTTEALGWELVKSDEQLRIRTVGPQMRMHSGSDEEDMVFTAGDEDEDRLNAFLESSHAIGRRPKRIQYKEEPRDLDGNTALMLAAESGDDMRVVHLLQRGSDINAQNFFQWTALMTAAFMGHTAVVLSLVLEGADQNIKDKLHRVALDLAGDDPELESERKHRNWSPSGIGEKRRQRALIRVLLGREMRPPIFSTQNFFHTDFPSQISDTKAVHTLRPGTRNSGLVHLLAPLATLQLASNLQSKTFAVLLRGGSHAPIFAISGWNGSANGPQELLVNKRATKNVLDFCKMWRFSLPCSGRDWGEPGRMFAAHCEKQLLVAFLLRHRFLNFQSKEKREKLESIKPACDVWELKLLIDAFPCNNCLAFKNLIQENYAVKVHLEVIGRGHRMQSGGAVVAKGGAGAGNRIPRAPVFPKNTTVQKADYGELPLVRFSGFIGPVRFPRASLRSGSRLPSLGPLFHTDRLSKFDEHGFHPLVASGRGRQKKRKLDEAFEEGDQLVHPMQFQSPTSIQNITNETTPDPLSLDDRGEEIAPYATSGPVMSIEMALEAMLGLARKQ